MNLTLTDGAREQIAAALAQQSPEKNSLRVEARTNGTAEFVYTMKLVDEGEKTSDDVVVSFQDLEVILDPASARHLEGATIDFEEGILQSGFKFKNPNKPELPWEGRGPAPELTGRTAEKVEHLINTEINSAVASHGGRVDFVGVRDNKAYLSFGGGCHGCGMVDVTLKQGIEGRIKELIPEIVEVVDVTDHSTGENPFYR